MGSIAYCGLLCETCLIYLATKEANNEEKIRIRLEVIKICIEKYQLNYRIAEIKDCDGCQTEGGRLFPPCYQCGIRRCAKRKSLETCAQCNDYPCQQLDDFFAKEREAKIRLDELKLKLN